MTLSFTLPSWRRTAALGASLALVGTSGALAALPAAAADEVRDWATVTGHAPHSSGNNQVATWCGLDEQGKPNGIKLGSQSTFDFQLPAQYAPYGKVIVKAAANNVVAANTVFAAPPTAGQWVWADTNGDNEPNDKHAISHIIICRGTEQPPPTTSLTVTKAWEGTEQTPSDYVGTLSDEAAGTLTVTVAGDKVDDFGWGDTVTDLAVDASASVSEGDDFSLPALDGYTCTVVGTSYAPAATITLKAEGNAVVVTNTVDCTENPPPPTTSLTVTKEWAYGEGVPLGYELTSVDAGTLEVSVDGQPTLQDWNDVKDGLPIEGTATVTEGAVPNPKDPQGYVCTIEGSPEYKVNGAEGWASSAEFSLTADPNTVIVRNTVDCTRVVLTPPTATLTVTKAWTKGPGVPTGYPTLNSSNAGTLTVTPTGQAWDVTTNVAVGTDITVAEAANATLPAYEGYTCAVVGQPSYSVNGGAPAASATFDAAEGANTVVVTNTLDCTQVPTTPPTDGVVGGDEDTDGSGTTDDDEVIASSEDELASTGTDLGPAGLGLLLVLAGAAFVTARRLAMR